MRKRVVAGNWKMNTNIEEGLLLVKEIDHLVKDLSQETGVIIAPPFTHLATISSLLKSENSRILLAAQNCADHQSGAYTGEVSPNTLAEIGCKYVIIGHSERREYYSETNDLLLRKIELVLKANMSPIYCIGERLEERESNRHFDVVSSQIKEVLYNLSEEELEKVIIAYEPVWAIGTGKTASSDQAEEMHEFIRGIVADKFPSCADNISILYGGSCKPSNAQELFARKNVDGGLIGGASLSAVDFAAIIKSF
jgi:triosephosphate isomerase